MSVEPLVSYYLEESSDTSSNASKSQISSISIKSALLHSQSLLSDNINDKVYKNNFRGLSDNSIPSSKHHSHHHSNAVNGTSDRGYVLCGNNKHRLDLIRMHYQLRHTWKSSLPIAIMHCDELYEDSINLLKSLDDMIVIIDICPDTEQTIFNMSTKVSQKRLRSFFCKVAALIRSPFNDTMILDSDTIWFDNPENLFYSKSYLRDGSLFFRDRVFHYVEGIGE